ncbi:AtpZ/AtpI family protein [Pseudodesulfovibrio tunisiensis]|uniref:AtpZ/AtpI family protein n=1 Tax=Pseudodesulfovibrio tunisiensis TaxID=463192 RepID=UPI001FB2E7AF|nr:AtpZ/AtpI family protein [Pseudodesulfovibrio tunisiensis]
MSTKRKKGFPDHVGERERRSLKAKKAPDIGAWYGMTMFGVVGWAVAVPTLMGVFVGVWIDLTWPGPRSWTLMLLVLGIGLGCANAWFWLNRQRKSILEERDRDDTRHD